jgi:hypothetical protein
MKTRSLFFIPPLRPVLAAGLLGLAAASAHASGATPPATLPPASASPGAAAAPEEDIRDIRPPFHIPSNLPWILGAASAAALAAAGYGAWRWTRKGARKLLPYEIALEKLEATRPLIHPETAREFSIAVSEIVRSFIEQCFPVRAAHRTTDEFLHELAAQSDSPLAAHREAFAPFLEHCDLAKFARWNLPEPQMEAMLDSARAFILSIANPTPQPTVSTPTPAARGSRHSDPKTRVRDPIPIVLVPRPRPRPRNPIVTNKLAGDRFAPSSMDEEGASARNRHSSFSPLPGFPPAPTP